MVSHTLEESQANGSTFFQKDGSFYFWRNDRENYIGPFTTEGLLNQGFSNYVDSQQAAEDAAKRAWCLRNQREEAFDAAINKLGRVRTHEVDAVTPLLALFNDYRDAMPLLMKLLVLMVERNLISAADVRELLRESKHG